MGPKTDVEIAKFLARQAEEEAQRTESPATTSEWRWSRAGWGDWSGEGIALDAALPSERDTAAED